MVNNKFKIRNSSAILMALFAALWFTGCTRSSDELPVIPENESQKVAITVTIPDAGIPSTRSMAGGGEDQVQSIDLLIFDATDSDHEIFMQWVEAESGSINTGSTDGVSYVTFQANLDITDFPTRIVVVANSPLGSIVSGFNPGVTEKKDVMAALAYSTPGSSPSDWKWKADDSNEAGYTAIPMYGEKLLDGGIHPLMRPISDIVLTRMLARIDITNSASGFTVDNVYLVNYNTAGYIAPAWNEANGQLLGDVPATPLIPSDPGKKVGAANAIPYEFGSASSYEGEIYTYESPAAAEWEAGGTDPVARQEAACLIIEGHIGSGAPSFYRVDFALEDGSAFMPLIRNYKYIIDIREVSGVGFADIGQAIQSYSVVSNLKTRLIYYNRSLIKNIVYNGQHMLGAGESDIDVSRYGATVEIDMFTDSPGGWTAAVTKGGDWLKIAGETTGAANDNNKLYADVPYLYGNEGDSRTGTISVTAGRLSLSIDVTQTITSEGVGTLKVIDEYGNPVERMFFQLNKASQAEVEPQTIYVVWTGAGSSCQASLKMPGESGNPLLEYVTFSPFSPDPDRSKALDLYGGIQAFTIQPEPGSEDLSTDWWRDDYLTINLYDQSGKIAEHGIYIAQGDLIFNFGVNPGGYLLGNRSYEIPLESNAKWTITDVTAIGAVLNQLLVPGGDIRVGNFADPEGGSLNDQLTLNVPAWSYNVSGTIRVTFELVYADNTFNRVYDIAVRSTYMDYLNGTNNDARYYVWPTQFTTSEGIAYMDYSTAEDLCAGIGPGWRLPTISELQMSYAYVNALGGMNGTEGWFWPHYWSGSKIGSDYMTVYFDAGYMGLYAATPPPDSYTTARCVYVNSSPTGTLYPYIDATMYSDEGVLIVSREGDSGVDLAALDPSGASNKVAQKLLVANANLSGSMDWDTAKDACSTSMGTGWRLPTQREVYLVMSLGGTAMEITNPGYGSDVSWPSGSGISLTESVWTLTEAKADNDGEGIKSNAWIFITKGEDNLPAFYPEAKTTDWGGVRCVKSVE